MKVFPRRFKGTMMVLSSLPHFQSMFRVVRLNSIYEHLSHNMTGNDKNIKVLLETVNAKSRLKSDVKHKKNYCSWYGQCYKAGPVAYNCAYNKKAKDLDDEVGLNILKEYCPSIYGDGTDVRTCCDTEQLQNMKDNMQVPYTVSFKAGFTPVVPSLRVLKT